MKRSLQLARLYLRQFTFRHWTESTLQSVTLIMIVALGVGMVLSIRLANRAAVQGFALFTDTVTGEQDFILMPNAGKLTTADAGKVRQALGTEPAFVFPVLESMVELNRTDAFDKMPERMTILGLDLVAIQNLAYTDDYKVNDASLMEQMKEMADDDTSIRQIAEDPQTLFISQSAADFLGVESGATITLNINTRQVPFTVLGIIPAEGEYTIDAGHFAIMDLGHMQTVLDIGDTIHRLEIRLEDGPNYDRRLTDVQQKLEAAGDGIWITETPTSRRATGSMMTAAFRHNLFMLSLLSLVIGFYLIMQAMEGAVAKRRSEISILRSMGVSAGQIQSAWLLESLMIGLVGSVVGILLGLAGSQVVLSAIAKTVSMLYFNTNITHVDVSVRELLAVFGLGTLTAVLAGYLPARDAASTPPAHMIRSGYKSGSRFFRMPILGIVLLIVGTLCLQLPPIALEGGSRFPLGGYLAVALWIVGSTSIIGLIYRSYGYLTGPLGHSVAWLRYALSQFRRPTARHYLTLAGFLMAIGMSLGMSIMIASFEHTMHTWINGFLRADIYITSQQMAGLSSQNRIPPDTFAKISARSEVAAVDSMQFYPITLDQKSTTLSGISLSSKANKDQLMWIQEPQPDYERRIPDGQAICSESFLERYSYAVGDTIQLPTPQGPYPVKLIGVFADYGNERGSILISLEELQRLFDDENRVSMSIYLKDPAAVDETVAAWSALFPELTIRSNASLRTQMITVFRQTFSITYVLQVIAIIVAVSGLGLALTGLFLERRKQLRVLTELGMKRKHIAAAVLTEGLGITLAGFIGGSILSLALGWNLIYVINKQSFGWTLLFHIPMVTYVFMGALILLVGCLISSGIGTRMAKLHYTLEEAS